MGTSDHIKVDVVAMVSSAGGLEALSLVLGALPADLPVPVVVQQHLGGHGSSLAPILEGRIPLTVEWGEDGTPLRPGHVVVCRPRQLVEILPDATLSVTARDATIDRYPHDVLLRSLADSFGGRALAVVLTGMGRDGAAGTAAVKAAGGIVFAQSPETASHRSMPQAAADAGADLVLPLHEIGPLLIDVVRGAPLPPSGDEVGAIAATFGDGGGVAAMARAINWDSTPLGPVRHWPVALRTTVRLAMDMPKPVILWLGEDALLVHNDAAVPTLGDNVPDAFGRPVRETFPDRWKSIRHTIDRVTAGEAVLEEHIHVPFVRHLRVEDAWWDRAIAPVREQDGSILGIFQVWKERTSEVLAARRLQTLNALAATPTGDGRRGTLTGVLAVLDGAADVLFAAAYLLDTAGTRATLVGAVGVEEGGPLAPRDMPRARDHIWPLHRAAEQQRPITVDDLASRFRGHVLGPDGIAPETAVLLPLRDEGEGKVVGVLILGINPRLPLDDRYREFVTLVCETVTGRVAESHARERERIRLDHLAELDRTKTELFANISHEFRTPLTLMLAPLEDMLGDPDATVGSRRSDIELVHRNARRLLRLVGTLLDFSQAEAGRLRARFAPVDLARLTGQIASMFASAAEAASLELHVDTPPLGDAVWVDVEMWEKVVSNLLSNALKFTWKGSVTVSLRRLTQHAELTVADTGVGIPADERPYVFDRFHRVRDTRGRTQEGAGIGLALVNELVRRHHGRVRVTSEVGRGSTFTVWIPLGWRPDADETAPEPVVAGSLAMTMAEEAVRWDADRELRTRSLTLDGDGGLWERLRVRAPGARVLVVDDSADMRDYLVRLLGADWELSEARDGNEALAQARAAPPDLILADVMMPGMDGFTMVARLRADPALADIPVILLTARAGEETAIEGLLVGADDYVVKPFSARELVARVGAQLELSRLRQQTARADAFRVALIDALRTPDDPDEIAARALAMLREYLGCSRLFYADLVDDGATLLTQVTATAAGVERVAGRWDMRPFWTTEGLDRLRRGEIVVVPDVEAAAGELPEPIRAIYVADGVRSTVNIPVLRDGRWLAHLAVRDGEVRDWTEREVHLMREVADRTWQAIERARNAREVGAGQARRAFLLALTDALRALTDPRAIKAAAARALGEHLGVARVMYGEITADGQDAIVERSWVAADEADIEGRFHLDDFGAALLPIVRRGETLVVGDVTTDDRLTADDRASYAQLGITAYCAVPLLKDGRFIAALNVQDSRPRDWSADDIALMEEVAERTWAAVERSRAEQETHQLNRRLEQQFRALVDAVGQTVWTTDAEGRVVDDSPSWRAFTGQTFDEWVDWGWVNAVHPDDRAFAARSWAQAVDTGTPVDTEFRLRHARSQGWHLTRVRAIPLRNPDGTVRGWLGMNTDLDD